MQSLKFSFVQEILKCSTCCRRYNSIFDIYAILALRSFLSEGLCSSFAYESLLGSVQRDVFRGLHNVNFDWILGSTVYVSGLVRLKIPFLIQRRFSAFLAHPFTIHRQLSLPPTRGSPVRLWTTVPTPPHHTPSIRVWETAETNLHLEHRTRWKGTTSWCETTYRNWFHWWPGYWRNLRAKNGTNNTWRFELSEDEHQISRMRKR